MVTPYGQLQKCFLDQETIFYFIYITIVKITGDGFKSFDEGQRVQFDILKGQRCSQAENVSKIKLISYPFVNMNSDHRGDQA